MQRRFTLFLFGFIAGIILVIVVYGNKADGLMDWTPEGRVLKRLRMTEKVISDSMACLLECNGIDSVQMALLLEDGDIDFGRARLDPPIYELRANADDAFSLAFKADGDISTLIEINGSKPCVCH